MVHFMAYTLKRQAENVNYSSHDDLDDDEYTWGNKKSKYLRITPNLQSPDLFSNIIDSDQTESNSTQSKSTIKVTDTFDFSFETSSCGCDFHTSSCGCDSQTSSKYDHTEFEITKKDILINIDKGFPTIPDIHFLSHYKKCIKCKKENSNPRFQYCFTCFNFRKQLFDSNPDRKPKRIKRLVDMTVEDNSPQGESSESVISYSQESVTSNSQESVSMGLSGLYLSRENMIDTLNDTNKCNICYLKPKNGIFNHGSTAHLYCCYKCAKQIWNRSGRCPICNLKVKYVTKAVYS